MLSHGTVHPPCKRTPEIHVHVRRCQSHGDEGLHVDKSTGRPHAGKFSAPEAELPGCPVHCFCPAAGLDNSVAGHKASTQSEDTPNQCPQNHGLIKAEEELVHVRRARGRQAVLLENQRDELLQAIMNPSPPLCRIMQTVDRSLHMDIG